MIVVGGYYQETCVSPGRDDKFGSGGRAALACALAGCEVEWHYYCPEAEQNGARIALLAGGLDHRPYSVEPLSELIRFHYFHPLSKPQYTPSVLPSLAPIRVKGDVILRFGFMEGDAVVEGKRVVFDPQSPNDPVSFGENGSTAEALAIVLNAREVRGLGEDENEHQAVANIYAKEAASVILVKAGPHGCRVYVDGVFEGVVPPYKTNRVYKIGSGDVFSAAFAYHWAEKKRTPMEAADAASRCVARYCDTRVPSVLIDADALTLQPIVASVEESKVYIAGPFFTMPELWLVEEACKAFYDLGVDFFSPYHAAGLLGVFEDTPAYRKKVREVVQADLDGLEKCTAVFAILDGCDPGTIFEIGWAVARNIPVVALSQNPKPADQTMILGSDKCSISDDFASAVYRAAWAAWSA